MKYLIAIEPGDDTQAFGVVVPDLPGCFSAGDSLEEAIDNAKEAIGLWLETRIDDGGEVPMPGAIAAHQAAPEFAGWIWAILDFDLASLSGKSQRINITLPRKVLRRLDAAAKVAGESRSAYLARRVPAR